METIVLNIEVNQDQLNALEEDLVAIGKAAGLTEDEIKGLNNSLSEQVKQVSKLRAERERLIAREKELAKLQRQTTDTDDLEAYTDELEEVRRELARVSKELKGVDQTAKKTGESASKSAQQMTKGFGNLLGVIGAIGAAAGLSEIISQLGEFGQASVETFADVEQLVKTLESLSPGENIDIIVEQAKQLGATTEFTTQQVLELDIAFKRLGFSPKQIEEAAEATIDFATAAKDAEGNSLDLGAAATIVAGTMNALQLPTSETAAVMDVLLASFSNSALDAEKFNNAIKFVGPAANATNVDLEALTAGIGALVDVNIEASSAGRGLRKILGQLGDENSKLAKKVGFTVNSSEDFTKALKVLDEQSISLADATDLVGEEFNTQLLVLANSSDKVTELANAYREVDGLAARSAATIRDSLTGALDQQASAVEGLQLAVGEKLANAYKRAIQFSTELISSITRFIRVPVSEKVREQQAEFNTLTNTLIRLKESGDESNATQETQAKIVEQLNTQYAQFLPELIKVTDETDALTAAQDAANKAFERRITLLAQQEVFEEAQRQLIENQKEQLRLEVELQKAIDGTNEKSGTRRAVEGIAESLPVIGNAVKTINAANDALNSQVTIEARLNALKREREQLDADLVTLQGKLIQDGGIVTDDLKKQSDSIADSGISISKLKGEIQALTEQFEKSTVAAERTKLASQIVFKQKQVAELELLIKPDKKTKEKISKEQERLQAEADKLNAAVIALRAQIEIDAAGGAATLEGLRLIEARTIESLTARKEFAELTAEEQEQGILNIQEDFAAKREAIIQKESDNRVAAAKKAQEEEARIFQEGINARINALTRQNVALTQEQLEGIRDLEDNLEAGLITYFQYADSVTEIEEGIQAKRLELNAEFLRDVIASTNARIAENQKLVDTLEQQAASADFTGEQQSTLQVLRSEQETLTAEILSNEQALADAELQIIKDKNAAIIASEEGRGEDWVAIYAKAAGAVSQIIGSSAGFFEAAKARELAAAGENAEAREEIETRFAKKQQQLALAQTAIQGSVAVIRAYAELGPIGGAISALLLGAKIAGELSNIKAQQLYEGTAYATEDGRNAKRLRPNRNKRGRDKIAAYLHEGERVTPSATNARYFDDLNVIEDGALKPGVVSRVSDIAPGLVKAFLADPESVMPGRTPKQSESVNINPIREQIMQSIEPLPSLRVINRDFTGTVNVHPQKVDIDYTRLAQEVAAHSSRAFWGTNSGQLEMLREIQNSNVNILSILSRIANNTE